MPQARGSFSKFLPELVGQFPVPGHTLTLSPIPAGLGAAGFLPGMAQPQVQRPSGFQPEAFPSLNLRSSWGPQSPRVGGFPSTYCPRWDLQDTSRFRGVSLHNTQHHQEEVSALLSLLRKKSETLGH